MPHPPHVSGQRHHRFRVARPYLAGLRMSRHQGDVPCHGGQPGPGQDEVACRWAWREQMVECLAKRLGDRSVRDDDPPAAADRQQVCQCHRDRRLPPRAPPAGLQNGGRARIRLSQFLPADQRAGRAFDADRARSAWIQPHHLPASAVVNAGGHGQPALHARQVGAVPFVQTAAAAVTPLPDEGGSADIPRRDPDRSRSSVRQGVHRQVHTTRCRLFRAHLVPGPPRRSRRRRPHRVGAGLQQLREQVMAVLLVGVVGKRDPRHLRSENGTAPRTGENDQAPLPRLNRSRCCTIELQPIRVTSP